MSIEQSSLDFSQFDGPDLYDRYFAQVARACELLSHSYEGLYARDGVSREALFESKAVVSYLRRFLATLSALKMRNTYRDRVDRPLYIDLTDSGFPNYQEIMSLEADAMSASQRLKGSVSSAILKRKLVDNLIREGVDQPEILAQLSVRAYLHMAEKSENLFLSMSDVQLSADGEEDGVRKFMATWGFYDSVGNLPNLYLFAVDQDLDDTPLTEASAERDQFLEIMRREGNRSGDLLVVATEFDEKIYGIHPKFLKRMRMGPLYSKLLLEARDQSTLTSKERAIYELLSLSPSPDDVMLFGKDDIVFSVRQEKLARSFLQSFGFKKSVREIFYIPENDLETYAQGVSHGHEYVLLPHRVVQHIDARVIQEVPELGPTVRKITYNEKGVVHAV